MKPVGRYRGDYRWEGVPLQAYDPQEAAFRDVTRQVLFGSDAGLASELRYFELPPGGSTRLERHVHSHAVLILRGEGRALVGEEIHALRPFDRVLVGPMQWHQFRADGASPLGFLCLVDRVRDRPQRPTPEQLASLRADPELAAFLRP